jgi:DNA-binding response OmpR family regulator
MGKHVMIIDDSLTVRKIVEVSLRRKGIDCACYANGYEALRALSAHEEAIPDLVFLDVGLPKMDGYHVAQRLKAREEYKHTVIVMLTGYSGILARLKGRLAGAKDYMTKPFKTEDIVAVVQEYLDISLA